MSENSQPNEDAQSDDIRENRFMWEPGDIEFTELPKTKQDADVVEHEDEEHSNDA